MSIEVLIADDHAIIRDGLKNILADTPDLIVAGEACNGNAVVEMVRERDWGLLVLDLSMRGRSGIERIKQIKAERHKRPVLVFSMHPEEQYAVRAIRAGASGYLSKEADSDLLLPAMRKVAAGGVYVSAKVAELFVNNNSPQSEALPHTLLTDREYQIFEHIVRGISLTDIGEMLSLSVKTISTHKSRIMSKMHLDSHLDMVRYAIDHKLIDEQD